jgi:hypothetical protein
MSQHDEDMARIREKFADVPLYDRAMALALAAVEHDPRTPSAIIFVIALAKVMARHLPDDQRTAVVWHLAEALTELEARWN